MSEVKGLRKFFVTSVDRILLHTVNHSSSMFARSSRGFSYFKFTKKRK